MYNGYPTKEAWNVALWINNDEAMYNYALLCLECCDTISGAVVQFKSRYAKTPDGVRMTHPLVDEAFRDLLA